MKTNAKQMRNAIAEREKIIAQKEKRNVSFHEAGHAAICARFGGYGVARVWRNTQKNVKAGEMAWRGSFSIFAEPGLMTTDEATRRQMGVLPTPENWRVLVGLAGLVAEKIAGGVSDAEAVFCSIEASINLEEVSETDINLMGDWQYPDVVAVMELLLGMWPDIEREAGHLAAGAEVGT